MRGDPEPIEGLPHRGLKLKLADVTVLVAYAPTSRHPQDREVFFDALSRQVPRNERVIILGDLNADLRTNDFASTQMQAFLARCNLITTYECLNCTKTTWTSNDRQATQKTLDYVAVSRRFASACAPCGHAETTDRDGPQVCRHLLSGEMEEEQEGAR